jgi:hypothetical protein
VDIDLAQDRVAGVNESMRCVCWNNDDAARQHLALFISHCDGGAAFEGKCDLDVRMRMQMRALPGPGLDDVGGQGRALSFADELIRHSNKRQLLEIDEAHGGNLRESPRSSRVNFEVTNSSEPATGRVRVAAATGPD